MKKIRLVVIMVILSLCMSVVPAMALNEIIITNVTSNAFGNIFFDGMDKSFIVEFESFGTSSEDVNVSYTVTDIAERNTDTVYFTENKTITIDANSKYADVVSLESLTRYDVYELHINLTWADGALTLEKMIPFSVCVNGAQNGGNPHLATSFHVSWENARLPETAVDIVKNAGFSQVRDSYLWSAFESTKGVFTEPVRYTNLYSELRAKDVGSYAICAWGNSLYGMETDNHMPITDEQRAAFANFVCHVIEENIDVVEAVEIWNEPDLKSFNPGEASPEDYAKLLKAVYTKVRSNPKYDHVKIAAPALAGVTSWLYDFLNADLDGDGKCDSYKYFDILSVHHYGQTYVDSANKYLEVINNLNDYNAQDKEIYHTEFGSHQAYNNDANDTSGFTSEHMQASRIARYYLTIHAMDTGDRFFIYDFTDEPLATELSEKTFGITHAYDHDVPYLAKPALLAVSNINNLLCESYSDEYTDYFETTDGIAVATFQSAFDKREVKAMFRKFTQGHEEEGSVVYRLPADSDAEKVTFYDMLGNKKHYSLVGDCYEIDVTHEPVYAVYEYGDTLHMYPRGDKSVVFGTLLQATRGNPITVKVLNKNRKIVYIDESAIGENGEFEFSFKTPEHSEEYTLCLGNESFSEVYTMTFKPYAIYKSHVSLTDENRESVNTLADFVGSDKIVVKSELLDKDISDFRIIVAYYSGSALNHTKVIKQEDMTERNGTYEYELEASEYDGDYDEVKVFIFDSLSGVTPLSKNIKLN